MLDILLGSIHIKDDLGIYLTAQQFPVSVTTVSFLELVRVNRLVQARKSLSFFNTSYFSIYFTSRLVFFFQQPDWGEKLTFRFLSPVPHSHILLFFSHRLQLVGCSGGNRRGLHLLLHTGAWFLRLRKIFVLFTIHVKYGIYCRVA